jgi:hypothetical protein
MADLSITAANVLSSANAAPVKSYNYGATITAGQLVYLDSNNKWQLTDADASSAGNNANSMVGVALVGGANNQPGVVALRDVFFTPGATLTNGIAYYASRNAGAICPVADVGAGNYATVIGIARSTTVLNLNPTPSGITV